MISLRLDLLISFDLSIWPMWLKDWRRMEDVVEGWSLIIAPSDYSIISAVALNTADSTDSLAFL